MFSANAFVEIKFNLYDMNILSLTSDYIMEVEIVNRLLIVGVWRVNMEKRVFLRAFEYSDLAFINELRNDDTLYELTCGNKYHISSERDKKWIEDKIFNNYHQLYLVVCSNEDKKPIGYISASNIDYINRKAELGGLVLLQEYSRLGLGTEATQLILDHLFGELGMNMVYTDIKEDHKASLRMAERLGFQIDGMLRDYVYKNNKFHNVYFVSILKSEHTFGKKNSEDNRVKYEFERP